MGINPEIYTGHKGEGKHEEDDKIETDFPIKEMTDREYQNKSLLEHQQVKDDLEKELIDWEKIFKEREKQGMTDDQRNEYMEKIRNLRTDILNAAKEKAEVEKQFKAARERKEAA